MDAHLEGFERRVLPVLVERGIGVLGMKPIGAGLILESHAVSAVECLQYALTLPTSVVITGCDSMATLRQAIDTARTFKPLRADHVTDLLRRTADAAEARRF